MEKIFKQSEDLISGKFPPSRIRKFPLRNKNVLLAGKSQIFDANSTSLTFALIQRPESVSNIKSSVFAIVLSGFTRTIYKWIKIWKWPSHSFWNLALINGCLAFYLKIIFETFVFRTFRSSWKNSNSGLNIRNTLMIIIIADTSA